MDDGYPHQLEYFIGDAGMYLQAMADFNEQIDTKPEIREGIYLSHPSDFEDARRDALYLQTVRQLLSSTTDGDKRLEIGDNRHLRAHLQNTPPDNRRNDTAMYRRAGGEPVVDNSRFQIDTP